MLFTQPAFAATLNVGSLWALYATPLAGMMGGNPLLHYLLLAHFFVAGYLFTVSIVGVDPSPHRAGFPLRTAVLVLAIAAHSVLARHIYINPPAGVPEVDAQAAGLLMYYGGDVVEVGLVVVFFAQWYRAGRPRRRAASTVADAPA